MNTARNKLGDSDPKFAAAVKKNLAGRGWMAFYLPLFKEYDLIELMEGNENIFRWVLGNTTVPVFIKACGRILFDEKKHPRMANAIRQHIKSYKWGEGYDANAHPYVWECLQLSHASIVQQPNDELHEIMQRAEAL